jgi:hypothetical protein
LTALDLKPRLLIATLAAGVGLAVALAGDKLAWIRQLDANLVMLAASYQPGEQHLVQDMDRETGVLTLRTLTKEPGKGRLFQSVRITDDPGRIFEHSPPSALDYAVILESLHNRGYDDVVLTTRMSWDEHPGLEAGGLGDRLARFARSAIPLPVTRAATDQVAPEPLQRAMIPLSRVSGNHLLIPIVNRVPLPAHTDGGANTLAGFSRIESAPASEGDIPLLANWRNQGLIPSIDLLAMMMAHKVSPAELTIVCGKHIRLGNEGPVIPIDDYGQTPAPDAAGANTVALPPPLDAGQLISPAAKHSTRAHIALIHASGEKTSATNTLSDARLRSLLALARIYPVPDALFHIRRFPLWAAIILVIDIALLSCWLADLSRKDRHLAYLMTAVLLFPLLMVLLHLSQHWLGLSAPLATLVTAWIIPPPRQGHKPRHRISESAQPYNPSDPRPAIRP